MERLEGYEFTSLSSSISDVSRAGSYLGRLYVLPALEPGATGITQQWFLTHAADFIASGYIDGLGRWSLSPYRSVEPTFQYFSQSEIFQKIFSPEYLREVQTLQQPSQQQPSELRQFDQNVATFWKNDSTNSGDEENNDSQVKSIPNLILKTDLENLTVLQQLVLAELEKSETEREKEGSEEISLPEEERKEQQEELFRKLPELSGSDEKELGRASQKDELAIEANSEQKETGGNLDFER